MRVVIFGVLLGVALIASAIGGLALYLESSSNDKAESSIMNSQLQPTSTPTSPPTATQDRTPTLTVLDPALQERLSRIERRLSSLEASVGGQLGINQRISDLEFRISLLSGR